MKCCSRIQCCYTWLFTLLSLYHLKIKPDFYRITADDYGYETKTVIMTVFTLSDSIIYLFTYQCDSLWEAWLATQKSIQVNSLLLSLHGMQQQMMTDFSPSHRSIVIVITYDLFQHHPDHHCYLYLG